MHCGRLQLVLIHILMALLSTLFASEALFGLSFVKSLDLDNALSK